jgi:hypothetical protein
MSESNESVTVEFTAKGRGKCRWCKKERDDVYEVSFGDGSFAGMLCKQDLIRTIDSKLPDEEPASVPANGVR